MNKKILGVLVAAGGIVATVAGSFALYSKVGDNKQIGIGVTTSSGKDIDYKVTDIVAPSKALSPNNTSDTFSFKVGAKYNASGDNEYPEQDIVVGNLTVTLTGSETLINNLTMDGTVGDYSEDSIGLSTYGAKKDAVKGTAAESKNTLTYTFEGLAVHTAGQTVTFNLGFTSSISQSDFLSIAEEQYKIDISWQRYNDNYEFAILTGDFINWSQDTSVAPIMMPDIDRTDSNFGWVIKYNFVTDATVIAKKGDTWSGKNTTFNAGQHTLRWVESSANDVY